jgi:hypothetical protein
MSGLKQKVDELQHRRWNYSIAPLTVLNVLIITAASLTIVRSIRNSPDVIIDKKHKRELEEFKRLEDKPFHLKLYYKPKLIRLNSSPILTGPSLIEIE